MPRARMLKFEFFDDDGLARLPPHDRLAYQGLWCLADRAGRLKDEPIRLRARIFPFEPEVDMDAALTRLAQHWITRYVGADGRHYIQVCNLARHQHFHHREPHSALPGPGPAQGEPEASPGPAPVTPRAGPTDTETDTDTDTDTESTPSNEGESADTPSRPSVAAFVAAWHRETAHPIGRCLEVSAKRRKAILARLRERSLDDWREVFRRIQASAFCKGRNDRHWVASFDWVLQPETAVKVLEGKYDAHEGVGPAVSREDWCRDHDPPCKTQQEHIRRTLEAARAARQGVAS